MADINLLTTEVTTGVSLTRRTGVIVARLLAVLLILLIGLYLFLFIRVRSTDSSIIATQQKTRQAQQEALNNKDRQQLVIRQAQLQHIDTLLKDHLYWSYLLPELSRITLQSAHYATLEVDSTGKLAMNVSVPNYAELDKFLQVFDLPEYNSQFSNVKVLSITKAQEGELITLQARVQLTFNPAFIKNRIQ